MWMLDVGDLSYVLRTHQIWEEKRGVISLEGLGAVVLGGGGRVTDEKREETTPSLLCVAPITVPGFSL